MVAVKNAKFASCRKKVIVIAIAGLVVPRNEPSRPSSLPLQAPTTLNTQTDEWSFSERDISVDDISENDFSDVQKVFFVHKNFKWHIWSLLNSDLGGHGLDKGYWR